MQFLQFYSCQKIGEKNKFFKEEFLMKGLLKEKTGCQEAYF